MSLIVKRAAPPVGGRGINYSHPRAAELVFAASMRPADGWRNLVKGTALVPTGMGGLVVAGGIPTRLFGSSSYVDFTPPPEIGANTPFTLAWTQQYTAASATSIVLNVNFGSAGTHKSFCVLQSATAGYYFVAGPRAAVAVPTWGSIGVPVNNRPNRYVLQCFGGSQATSNSDYALWRDGELIASSGGSGITNHTGALARIGARDTGADPFEGAILDLRMWARILSDADALEESRLERAGDLYEPLRIWVPVSAGGGGTTVALSGVSATFAQTAPTISSTASLAGESATASAGVLLPTFSLSLSGQAGVASAGNLSPNFSCGLSGQSATFAAGSVIPSVAIAVIGLQATFSPGTLTASSSGGDTAALVGEVVTFAQTAPSVSVTIALTGIAATMAAGILSASSGTATITVKAGSWLRYKKLQ